MRVKDQELKDLPLRLKMSIKKSRNLEDVFSTYDSSQIETKGNIEVTNSGNLKKAIKFYENELNKNELSHYKYFPFKQYNNKEAKSIILDSSELDQFLKLTTIHEEDKNYQIVTGLILTQFIKNSNLKGLSAVACLCLPEAETELVN